MQLKDCYFVGTITKKHGLKGHVVLKLDTDEPSFYHTMESVLISINEVPVPFFIKEITVLQNDILRIFIEDIDPDSLIGKKIFQPLDQLPPLTGTKFYFHEVIDFDIRNNNEKVGVIKEIIDNVTQPLLVITKENSEELLIPIVKDWIMEVNRTEKYLSMDLPDGILEL